MQLLAVRQEVKVSTVDLQKQTVNSPAASCSFNCRAKLCLMKPRAICYMFLFVQLYTSSPSTAAWTEIKKRKQEKNKVGDLRKSHTVSKHYDEVREKTEV